MQLGILILFFTHCISSTLAASPIKIGLIAELTGDMPAVGASCKNAAQLAVQEINDQGLKLGDESVTVELMVEDNSGKVEQSALSAQKLISQDRVLAFIGPNASRYAIPASEIAESTKTVMITPWSTNPDTTLRARDKKPKQFVFRACFIDPFQGRVLAKFAKENLKAGKVAVLYDVASDYNKGIAEIFKTTFEGIGGQVVAFETYTTGDKDFSAQLTKMKSAGPDVIFLPNYYSEVPLQIQQAHRLGITVPFLGSDSWGSDELLKLCGGECEGYYFSTHYSVQSATPAATRFIEAYKAKYGMPPDDVAALTYDSFGMLFQALRNAGKADKKAVRDALAQVSNFEGVTGTMKFQDSGDPIKSAVILQIKDGTFTWVTNAEP